MEYLIIFNSLVSISIVGFALYKYFPFYFEINKTFWCKKPYSITLWVRTSGNRLTNHESAKGLFTFSFRNKDKLEEWDLKVFKSRQYKTYIK